MKHLAILAWAVSSAFLPCLAGGVLRTAGEINRYVDGEPTAPADFAITATVTYITTYPVQPPLQTFYCESPSGAIRILNIENPMPKPGDVVSVSGQLSFDEVGNAATYSNLTLSVIGHVEPPRPEAVPLPKLDTHLHHNRYIETEGTVVDVIPDDISRRTAFLLIADGGMESGYDAFKALALGADAVTVGRSLMAPLRDNGSEGVREVITFMTKQLQAMMFRTGSPDLKHIDPSVIRSMN